MQDKAKYQTKTLQRNKQSRKLHKKSRYKNPQDAINSLGFDEADCDKG